MAFRERIQPTPPVAFPEPWLGWWRLAVDMTWVSLHPPSDARQLRSFWSTNLSETMDRTLRSPEFLELMASNLKAMAAATRLNSQLRLR